MSTGTWELSSAGGGLCLDEMELTLGLPGDSRERKCGTKRSFLEMVDLKLGSSSFEPDHHTECQHLQSRQSPSKERVIGWPPVRSYRKNMMGNICKYVKVAVDGAPYLRKIDLKSCTSYQQLVGVFDDMFSCFTIHNVLNEDKKMMDHGNRSEYVPTYEDKDGDWMLVGDVPWKMFVDTCKRIRLTKSSEAITQLGLYDNTHLLLLE